MSEITAKVVAGPAVAQQKVYEFVKDVPVTLKGGAIGTTEQIVGRFTKAQLEADKTRLLASIEETQKKLDLIAALEQSA